MFGSFNPWEGPTITQELSRKRKGLGSRTSINHGWRASKPSSNCLPESIFERRKVLHGPSTAWPPHRDPWRGFLPLKEPNVIKKSAPGRQQTHDGLQKSAFKVKPASSCWQLVNPALTTFRVLSKETSWKVCGLRLPAFPFQQILAAEFHSSSDQL